MGLTNRKRRAYKRYYYHSNKHSLQKNVSSSGKIKRTKQDWYERNSRSIVRAKRKQYTLNPSMKKEKERERYALQPEPKKEAARVRYASQPEAKKEAARQRYASQPEPKRMATRQRYASQPEAERLAARQRYASQREAKRLAAREHYASQPEIKRTTERKRYASQPEDKKETVRNRYASQHSVRKAAKSAMKMRYKRCHSLVLFLRRQQYYGSVLHKRAATVVQKATQCLRAKALHKSKQTKPVACSYSLHEPTQYKRDIYVRLMKRTILKKVSLRRKLICSFQKSNKYVTDNIKARVLPNAVANIAGQKTLHKALKKRKQCVGDFLACVRKVNDLDFTVNDFGDCYHTASSEPYFYDQSYTCVHLETPIVVDTSGRCVIAQEIGDRDPKSNRPLKWKCTNHCKLPTEHEKTCIVGIKALFKEQMHKLRQHLTGIDSGCDNGHYTCRLTGHELAGHPLTCTVSGCESKLRILRAASPHYPKLRRFLAALYESIRNHKHILSIDRALQSGNFEMLVKLCCDADYQKLLKSENVISNVSSVKDAPIGLQQQDLHDLETDLYLGYAEMIADLEKKLSDDAEFPCCSCERLHQRKNVTAFKFSDRKFDSDMWTRVKSYILAGDSGAALKTHYVCQYCRPILNNNSMPCRCVLNGLETEQVPSELQQLDPLSRQLIQRAKAFQAVYRLGTYTGNVPSYNSLKACKGTMFFLPLPLDKTVHTLEEIEKKKDGSPDKLPNPELFIIVNSKSKTKKNIWQSLINVNQIQAALEKLRQINWLYSNVDVSSLDEASRHIVESVSDTSSTMLEKVSAEDTAAYQSYTIRRLDQQQSMLPDSEQYQLRDVKEDALSNKLKHLDVLCFPTLFPSGKFGESHSRIVTITSSEYAKSRLLNKDGRFRKNDQYVFFLLWQKEMRELSAGIYNLLKSTRQHAMPVGEFVDRVSSCDDEVEGNLSTVFQSMRGSKQYWYIRRSEVLCMVREYGSPTLFLTLSCAEYDSVHIATYLRKVNKVSDSFPIGRLCTEDPVSVSRKFSQKFHDFFETVILKGNALGPVSHYFYKKEYQARGAPHYHILLWIDGAPVAGTDDDDAVLRWIQERITCRIPEEDSNPELHHLVTKYQSHKCNKYCRRRKRVKGTYITQCRFGFPRPTCESATLLSVDECMQLSHRKMYKLPRCPEEIRINNYNPLLLLLWKANMDLQFVGESSLAIAQYVTGYVTKAEKSNMQELWQEVSSHNSVYSKLWSFGVRSLRSRECGLYEASDLLLGDHLCGKSKTVKWIDVSLPHNRKRRLRNHSKLVEMRQSDPSSTSIFEDNLVDTFYPRRPSDMENVCLYDFVAEYTKCGVDDDGNPVYRKLGKTVLPNHKIYDPKKENEHESYFYSLLLLFVPFRNEAELIQQGENAESAFDRHMRDKSALNTHSEKLQKMLEARESVQKINEARQALEDVTDPEPLEEDDGPQVLGEARSAMNDVVDLHQVDKSCPSFEELVSSLNTDQARIFRQIKVHLEHLFAHENGECTCTNLIPLHMFVSGVGGTGKSFLIKCVRGLVSQIWQDRANCPVCAVSAPTGLAAFNVGGVTIHRLLQLPIEHEGRAAGYWRLGQDALKIMRASLSQLRLLIIDEVSMVSSLNLVYIHLRLEEIFARDQWFGGVNVLFVGDILQLPPVNGASVFEKMTNKSVASKLGCMTSVNIWQDCVVYDELTINERQKSDGVFSSMLDEVRRGCPSQKTIEALKERVITIPVVDKFQELLEAKKSPLCLFPTRKSCHDFNVEMLSRLPADTKEIPCVDEVDETTGTFKWNKKATEEMKKLNNDCNLTAGLEAVLQVAIGARVMLRRNIDTAVGLVNGALGTVISIRTHHITVQFDGMHGCHDIERVKSRFMVLNKIYVQRKQFPLILAFAVTVHKCQGLSLDCAMMDLSDQVFCAGMAYVALSRVRKLENLHLVSFSPQAIKVSTKCLQEINRLRQTYRPDMAQYAVPHEHKSDVKQKRKRKLTGTASAVPVSPKKPKICKPTKKRKVPFDDCDTPPKQKFRGAKNAVSHNSNSLSTPKNGVIEPPSEDTFVHSAPFIPSRYRYNPVTPEWQQQACRQLGLQFVRGNRITLGGPDVVLCPPTHMYSVEGDGNCLFCSLCYIITGSVREHLTLRSLIVQHLRTHIGCWRLLPNYIDQDQGIDEYIVRTRMDQPGAWGSTVEMAVLAHMLEVNIATYNSCLWEYTLVSPGIIEPDVYPEDYSRPTMYIEFANLDHFNVILSQD